MSQEPRFPSRRKAPRAALDRHSVGGLRPCKTTFHFPQVLPGFAAFWDRAFNASLDWLEGRGGRTNRCARCLSTTARRIENSRFGEFCLPARLCKSAAVEAPARTAKPRPAGLTRRGARMRPE